MVRFSAALTFLATLITGAHELRAQQTCPAPPQHYRWGLDRCLHRTPHGIALGLPHVDKCCPVGGTALPYTTATANQVVASLQCDFAAAGKATKGKSIDISKAVIKADVTFAYVNKNSAGVSLQIPAIPVFTGITVAPNLEASKTGESSQSDTWSFKVDPDALTSCPGTKAENNWLVTKLLTTFPKKTDIELSSLKTEVSFIVTKVGSAGFKLNIVPIAIGPQLGANQSNTQKVLINFDWAEKQKSAPSSKQPVSAAPASAVSPSKQ